MTNNEIVLASIAAIVAAGLIALSPSMIIGNVHAQMYDSQYGYDSNYYPQEKSSHVDIQKIKCVNSNINVNGIDITEIPQDSTSTAAANEGSDGTNAQNGNNGGLGDRLNVERNLVNVCANVNANDQLKVEPAEEPPTATLTVNKEIFGCSTDSASRMDCQALQNDSPSWLPCIGSSISSTTFCQNLPLNLFDIKVLDDQNIPIQEFEGSTAGTTIQNLQPGTYAVNEITHQNANNQLGQNDPANKACTEDRGFTDGGILNNLNTGTSYFPICFEYEDEQGNDCSTITLAAGEDKTCTVKNYILSALQAG